MAHNSSLLCQLDFAEDQQLKWSNSKWLHLSVAQIALAPPSSLLVLYGSGKMIKQRFRLVMEIILVPLKTVEFKTSYKPIWRGFVFAAEIFSARFKYPQIVGA